MAVAQSSPRQCLTAVAGAAVRLSLCTGSEAQQWAFFDEAPALYSMAYPNTCLVGKGIPNAPLPADDVFTYFCATKKDWWLGNVFPLFVSIAAYCLILLF